jgi:hypothetical protein
MPPKKKAPGVSKVKQTILAVAIAIVLALFVGFAIHAWSPGPKYDVYCRPALNKPFYAKADCEAAGGVWTDYGAAAAPKCPPNEPCATGYCDVYTRCSKQFNDANSVYTRTVFIIATIAGIIAVFVGGVVLKLESVSSGIMGGGVLTMIYGIIRYWMDASNLLRVVILGIILVVLIWMGYKKLNPNKL